MNRRNSVFVEAFGERKSLKEWANDSRCAVSYLTFKARVTQYGFSPEEALTAPPMR